MSHKLSIFSLLLVISQCLHPLQVHMQEHTINAQEKEITINFDLQPDEVVLKQTIKISIDSPHVRLSQATYEQHTTKQYVATFKDSKELFSQSFSMQTIAKNISHDNQDIHAKLHLSYLSLPADSIEEKTFELVWLTTQQDTNMQEEQLQQKTKQIQQTKSWTESLQNLVNNTQNNWVRLFLAFLLGLLLSLTPCIYPMIPITIGILHRQGKKSLLSNFLGSLCYAVGLSMTFATLGLFAAFFGASFGELLSKPLFVLVLVAVIGYLSLSMIGFFDLQLPSFMKNSTDVSSKFGPYLSAFLFGLLSGSIASPCVSPGLALLLTIVATMGNIFAGFLLLFAFGIGMSVPLMIIGTFSTSLQLLPQAGQWMVEIKKALGFIMMATCFYYLSNILPHTIVMWLLIGYLLFAALFYIIDAQKSFGDKSKTIKSLIGIILLAIAVFMAYKHAKFRNNQEQTQTTVGVTFQDDYQAALQQAKSENKLIIIDFWARYCTICKAIEQKIFHSNIVSQGLNNSIIFVKVDCTSSSNQESQELKKQFGVIALPAIIVLDPKTETVIKKWSSEPYNMTPDEFVTIVKELKA